MPRFLPQYVPWFVVLSIARTRGSECSSSLRMLGVSSVLASSTMMSSRLEYVCARIERTEVLTYCAVLYVVMITETRGPDLMGGRAVFVAGYWEVPSSRSKTGRSDEPSFQVGR